MARPLPPQPPSAFRPFMWVVGLALLLVVVVALVELGSEEPPAHPATPLAVARPVMAPDAFDPVEPVAEEIPQDQPALRGVVLDGETGAPVAGAVVVAQTRGASDAQGRFELRGVPAGARLHVEAAGYLPFSQEVARPDGTVTVRLARTTLLRVRVVRKNGIGVAGAVVDVSPPTPPRQHRTDGNGEVLLSGIQRGAYRLSARGPDGNEAAHGEAAVAERQHTTVTLTLAPAATVSGVVQELDGSPAAGASLWVETMDGARLGSGVAGPDGTYRLSGLPDADNARVHAVRDARHGESERIRLPRGGSVPGVVVTLSGAKDDIAGIVLDDDGAPVMGATVELAPEYQGGRAVWASTATDGDGRFSFRGVEDRHYDVTARLGELEAVLDDVRPGNRGIVLQLAASAMLEGRVVDEGGAPVSAFHVKVEFQKDIGGGPGGKIRRGMHKSADVFDAEGRFSVGPLRRGRYEVEVTTTDGRLGRGAGDILGRRSVDVGQITLRASGTVTGRVLNKRDGSAVAGAVITRFTYAAEPAISDADGRFSIQVPAGGNNLMVSHPGYFPKTVRAGNIDPNGAPVDVGDVLLVPGSRREIEGRNGFGGVGAVLRQDGKNVVIDRVMDEGAGSRAGLQKGDVILSVDGEEMGGKGVQEAVSNIRGEAGSTVWVTVKRGGEIIEVPVRREPVSMDHR